MQHKRAKPLKFFKLKINFLSLPKPPRVLKSTKPAVLTGGETVFKNKNNEIRIYPAQNVSLLFTKNALRIENSSKLARRISLPFPKFVFWGRLALSGEFILYLGFLIDNTLCYPPLPHIYGGARICQGGNPGKTLDSAIENFLLTPFNYNEVCYPPGKGRLGFSTKNIIDKWEKDLPSPLQNTWQTVEQWINLCK